MLHTPPHLTAKLIAVAALSLSTLAHAAGPKATDLYSRAQLSQSLASCAHLFPAGEPTSFAAFPASRQITGLCSNSFAVLHSGQTKTPLLAVERLNRAQLRDAKGEERTDKFYPDPRLKAAQRAHLDAYKGSGFDRGHLAPAADQPDAQSMAQSFALSNMVPQDPTLNRKVWSKLEEDTRKYASRAGGDVYVFTGPLFNDGQKLRTIGKGDVWVPTHMFKLVYDASNGKAWAHVLPNTSDARAGRPISYESFVRETGLKLLPLAASH